jgi:hypothetical protein
MRALGDGDRQQRIVGAMEDQRGHNWSVGPDTLSIASRALAGFIAALLAQVIYYGLVWRHRPHQ